MSDLLADLRHAFRALGRSPGFAIVAVLTVAVGIGATTAVFSLVHSVLLKPLPYPEADRLVDVSESTVDRPEGGQQASYPTYRDWSEGSRAFDRMAAYASDVVTATMDETSQRVESVVATPDLFPVLGVAPVLGRTFGPEETIPGSDRVVVLSHLSWQRWFGGRRDVLGRTVVLNRRPHTVIGVMPAGFAFPVEDIALWTPLIPAPFMEHRGVHILHVLARLRSDGSLAGARTDMAGLARRLAAEHGHEHPGHAGAAVASFQDRVVGDLRPMLGVLMAAVAGVLLIACANLAHLLLTRAAPRRREMAIRAALGAGRGRLVRLQLAEGVAISLLGAALGFGIAVWVIAFLDGRLPESIPRLQPIGVDGTVLAFTIATALLTGLATAAVPAFRTARAGVGAALQEAGARLTPGRTRSRVRRALVVGEVAVSLVLLIAGGLLLSSFIRVLRVDPGFRVDGVLTMAVSPSPAAAPDADALVRFYRRLTERVGAVPGVDAVSAVSSLPVSGGDSHGTLTIEGRAFPPGVTPGASYRRTLPGYFAMMRIPVVRGREFDERDDGTTMVTLIGESMARRFWPDADPIGQRIKIGLPENEPWLTIVGVVADVHNVALDLEPDYATYEPHAQRVWRTMQLAVRTSGDPLRLAAPVRSALGALDAEMIVYDVGSMRARVGASLAARRFVLAVLAGFAVTALTLALVGLYAVIAYTVAQRRRELGIRLALGARAAVVLRMVLGDAAALVVGGIGLGLAGALVLTRWLRALLFGVEPSDPVAFGAVAGLLLVVALLAAYVPARRAARINPVAVLRDE